MPNRTLTDDPSEWDGERPWRLFEELAEEPGIAAAFYGQCDALRAAMDFRTLELVALRASAVLACPYSWHGHCRIALRGEMPYADIAAVAVGPRAFTGFDAAVLTAVDELLAAGRLSTKTRAALGMAARSVTVATANYQLVTWVMDGIAPEPLPHVAGLETPADAQATSDRLNRRHSDHADHPEAA